MPHQPPEPPSLPGTIFGGHDRKGRRRAVRAIDGMLTTREATALTGVDGLTLRLWCDAFHVGARFAPRGPVFIYPHLAQTVALLRDQRGALPRRACERGSPRHHIVMLAIYAAMKAQAVPSDELINEYRRRLDLPPRPKRTEPPDAAPRDTPVQPSPAEVRHEQR